MENRLREGLESGRFVVTAEAIPGRGACEESQEKLLEEAKRIIDTGRVDAISITDNPGGNPALLADQFAMDVAEYGLAPLVHMTCKDRNRNQYESQLYAMQRKGIENLLIMSGDYPVSGWCGKAKASFDLDPVTMTMMTEEFNKGMPTPGRKPGTVDTLANKGTFFPGCVVNPYKYTEGELIPQFTKLKKKIFAGAKFIIAQVGYDSRALQALMFFLKEQNLNVPVIANIYVLTAGAGRFMNQGNIPGTIVTDEFLAVLNKEKEESADKGKEARLIRAAKMIAIAKGLGCAGVHIGGWGTNAENICWMLDKADELQGQWQQWASEISYGHRNGYYYYLEDGNTHLNSHEKRPRTENRYSDVKGNYGLSHAFHKMVFLPGKKFEPMVHNREISLYRKKGLNRNHGLEHMGKVMLYHCIDCGDCGLPACAYTCPMSHCPKHQRNGPCGGSNDGWCEVFPGQMYCIWFKAYYRLKHYHEEGKLDDYINLPNDWRFWQTSGWQSYHLNQDNFAKRIWLPDAEPDFEATHGRVVDYSDPTIPRPHWEAAPAPEPAPEQK